MARAAKATIGNLDANFVSMGASCISAGTDIYPGFFSLAFSQGWSARYGDSGNQVYVFRLFPVEQWLNLVGNTSHYADMRPLYGQQLYFVKAHFADGATTLSDTVDAAVENPELESTDFRSCSNRTAL